MRAIGYVRQSVAKHGESAADSLSLNAQEESIRRYCIEREWPVVGMVADHDVSGSDWNRPGIRELLDAANAGDVDTVVVYKLSRFARDSFYQELVYRELKKLNVTVTSVTEGGAEKTLIRLVYGAVNQHHNEELSQWVSDTIRQRAHRGKQHGEPPFGYRTVLVDGARGYAVESDQAEAVRMAFDLRISGKGLTSIADALNEAHVPAQGGGHWGKSSIGRMLRNPRYAGFAVHRGVAVGDSTDLPAIVDRATWEAVSRSFVTGQRAPREKSVSSWIEGLVDHGCGRKMLLMATPDRVSDSAFLCNNATGPKVVRCHLRPGYIVRAALETAVRRCLIDDMQARIANAPDALSSHVATLGRPDAVDRRSLLLKQRERVTEAMRRAEDLVLDGLRDHQWLREKTTDHLDRLARIDADLAELASIPTVTDLMPSLKRLEAFSWLLDIADGEQLRSILLSVGRVQFGTEGITIRYHADYRPFFPNPSVYTSAFHLNSRSRTLTRIG